MQNRPLRMLTGALLATLLLAGCSVRTDNGHVSIESGAGGLNVSIGGGSKAESAWQQSFPASDLNRLRLDTRNGFVTVEAGDQAQVSAQAVIRANAATDDEAHRLLEATKVSAAKEGPVLVVRLEVPQDLHGDIGASFTVTVPRSLALELRTSNGAVNVTGVSGQLNLNSSNGAISAKDTPGALVANTSNGVIRVSGGHGAQVLTTSNAFVQVEGDGSREGVQVHTSNGYIHLSGFQGGGNLETSSGQVSLDLGGGGAELDLSTSNGHISLPGQSGTAHHVTATVRGGGPRFTVYTSNNNIDVK